MPILGILDSYCYMLNTLLATIVFGMLFLACTNPAIDWQTKAAFFGGKAVLGTLS